MKPLKYFACVLIALACLGGWAGCDTGGDGSSSDAGTDTPPRGDVTDNDVVMDARGEEVLRQDTPGDLSPDVPWDTLNDIQGGLDTLEEIELPPEDTSEIFMPDICVADCEGKECGDDGCGGTCGGCDDGEYCTDDACFAGHCVFAVQPFFCLIAGVCVPSGAEQPGNPCQECKPLDDQGGWTPVEDGLECAPGGTCYQGVCCVPAVACQGKECGPDGCGGSCGECGDDLFCNAAGLCFPGCDVAGITGNVLKISGLAIGTGGLPGMALDVDDDPSTCTPDDNCQGGLNNQLGGLITQLEQYIDMDQELEKLLDDGDLVHLAWFEGFNAQGVPFTMHMFDGVPVLEQQECDWQTQVCDYVVAQASFDYQSCTFPMVFDNAVVVDGTLHAGGPDYSFPLCLPFFMLDADGAGTCLAVTGHRARVEGEVTVSGGQIVGLHDAILGLAIDKSELLDSIWALPPDLDLPVSIDLIVNMADMFVVPDIDVDGDGTLDAASLGVQHDAIAGNVVGLEEAPDCTPACDGTVCGPDGCGGSCGTCPFGLECEDGQCVPAEVCPTAVIGCVEGDEVIPQTVLHLYGDQSFATSGTIAAWEWSVDQPPGSQSVFVPSAAFPNPTFEVNVAGVYHFELVVYDELAVPSCVPDILQVVVIPEATIHVELLWHTPEDPDETDEGPEAGADLDLHFVHPYAGGPDLDGDGEPDGWFDQPYDCFWFNAHPEWGSFDPSIDDNPGLDLDDTDGAGPENINLVIPQDVTYRVGVHYWNDHGYGTSYATVRVYIYSQLAYEVIGVQLVDMDMWEVCTIEWPSGQVTPVLAGDGGYKIIPDYQNPFFFQD